MVLLASLSLAKAAAAHATITIEYFALDKPDKTPAASIDTPPAGTGARGAALAIADTNTTGRFTGQSFVLHSTVEHDPAALRAAFMRALAAGARLFVTDVPADLLLTLADAPGAGNAELLDATTADDRLRGADCRANTLHLLPSRAMLADALMQYFVLKKWTRITMQQILVKVSGVTGWVPQLCSTSPAWWSGPPHFWERRFIQNCHF